MHLTCKEKMIKFTTAENFMRKVGFEKYSRVFMQILWSYIFSSDDKNNV